MTENNFKLEAKIYLDLFLSNPYLKILSDQQFQAWVDSCEFLTLSANTFIFQKDEISEYGYFLISGHVGFGENQDKNLSDLQKTISAGNLFGIAPSLFGNHIPRDINMWAIDDVCIARFDINLLSTNIQRADKNQLSAFFPTDQLIAPNQTYKDFKAGDVIIKEGMPADNIYILTKGTVEVVKKQGDSLAIIGHIQKGGFFGERGILKCEPRAASIIAATNVETLVLDGNTFRKNVSLNPDAKKFFGELESAYNFPRRGIVVNGRASVNGKISATSSYNLLDGRNVLMALSIDSDNFVAQHCPTPKQINWFEAGGHIQAKIGMNENCQITSIESSKSWEALELASTIMLDRAILSKHDIEEFQKTGLLQKTFDNDTETQLICGCMGLTKGDIHPFIRSDIDLEDICKRTGAGSGCGSCKPRIGEMLSLNMKQRAKISYVHNENDLIKRFRFVGIDVPLIQGSVGQHIVIYAEIDGQQIERSFTLIEYAGAEKGYEIAVRLEPEGRFTPWLFTQAVDAELSLSVPTGDIFINQPQKLTMIAAGIGITPAMSILKAIARKEILPRDIKILHSSRSLIAPLQKDISSYLLGKDYYVWNSAEKGRIDETSISTILKPEVGTLFLICGPEQFEQDMICNLASNGIPTSDIIVERFILSQKVKFIPEDKPQIPTVRQSEKHVGYALLDDKLTKHEEKRLLLTQIHQELNSSTSKINKRLEQIDQLPEFEPNSEEIEYAAKLAWRNSTKCIGRLYWKGLEVFDRRDINTIDGLFDAMENHLRFGTNNGKIRSAVTIFKPFNSLTSFRILSSQLIRYAGYRHPDGTVTGDPANIDLTETAKANGWIGSDSHFDILPLMIEDAKGKIHLRELDKKDVLEINIDHPEFPWFIDLCVKWYALPAISNTCMSAFGQHYPIIMNGWYMGTEIGARNLADNYRYNLLPKIAQKMGCHRENDSNLWKDKALVELNIALLYSFRKVGVTIVDHHTAAKEFLKFIEQEHNLGRTAETDWSWVVPPMSGATTSVFHLSFSNKQLKPAIVGYPEKEDVDKCPFS